MVVGRGLSTVEAMLVRPTTRIAPSLLTGDFARLGDEVSAMQTAGADRIHWDVMDGCFVPNLTIGPDVVASARAHTSLPFDAHLMVADPDRLLARWVEAGCGLITVHAEACSHLHRTLGAVTELGAQAGVALNPATPPSAIRHVLDLVDLVLVMTVNPGFGGQRYLASMEPKIAAVAAMVASTDRMIEVEVDGGIGPDTVGAAARAGATTFVSGSAVYRHAGGKRAAITELRDRAEEVCDERDARACA
jgi:ribulose-phosphate 3-epimerase